MTCYTFALYTLEEFNEMVTDCLMIGMLCWGILKRLCCVIIYFHFGCHLEL